MTILFSHGSHETLGEVYPLLLNLSTILKCDVVSYDYSGYGLSTGIPSPEEINRDIYEVSHFCSTILKIDRKSLLLFGYSLGTTPTLYLGNHPHYKKLLVLCF